jgi:hypothetical protein
MTIINIASKKSIYIIPGSKSYTLIPEIYTPVDMDMLDSAGLYSVQRDLDVLIVSDNNTALRQYLSNKTIQGAVSAESIQDLMAATLINSVYDDEANTISIGSESGGGGFSFGGEWDATSQQTTQTAEFDALDNCTVVGSVFTPASPIGSAMATYIARGDVGTQIFRFTWPTGYASNDTFIVGFCTPSSETDIQNIFSGATTGMVGIGHAGGNIIATHKYGNEAPSLDAVPNSISANDIVRIEFSASTNIVSISNETTNSALANFDLGNYAEFSNSLSLFIYSAVPLTFELGGVGSLLQVFYNIVAPTDADGKTFMIINAGSNSIYDGKPLKNGDFVTFYNNAQNIMVSRLYTDAAISTLANTAITNALEVGGSIYNAIQAAVQ